MKQVYGMIVLVVCFSTFYTGCQSVPEYVPKGFKLSHEQNFDSAESLEKFEFTDPQKWNWTARGNPAGALESAGKGNYKPPVRSPFVIALIKDLHFGDFVLEADLLQTGREYGHRDMCLFFGFGDRSHFYYVHLATRADQNAHNIFLVNGEPRRNIAEKTTSGIDWGQQQWHRVRVVRQRDTGLIQVYFDDMSEPIMVAHDKTHGLGQIGFGSFDDQGRVDNIRVWSDEVRMVPRESFIDN